MGRILEKFREKLGRLMEQVEEHECNARKYSDKLLKEHSLRINAFHSHVLEDKRFLEELGKGESDCNSALLHAFMDFLFDGLNLIKDVRKFYRSDHKFHEIEEHRISQIIGKLIFSSSRSPPTVMSTQENEEAIASSRSRLSSLHSHRKKQRHDKSQKMDKIVRFLENLTIFDPTSVKEHEFFACALGPRLLLHGRLYILAEGMYYESLFNKRNIFFGKTKLFIPKEDILEID